MVLAQPVAAETAVMELLVQMRQITLAAVVAAVAMMEHIKSAVMEAMEL